MNHDQEVMVEDVMKRWCVLCVLLLWWDVSRGLKHFETLRLRSNTDVPERVKVPIEGIKTLRSQRGGGWPCTLKTSHCKYVPKIKKKKTQNCVCQSWHRSNKGIQICLIFLPCRWLHWALLPLPLLCFPAFCCYRAPAGETCRFPRRPRPFKSNKCLHELSECSFVTDGCKSRRKEGKKNRWNISNFLCYTGHCWGVGGIGGWWWAGPGGGRGLAGKQRGIGRLFIISAGVYLTGCWPTPATSQVMETGSWKNVLCSHHMCAHLTHESPWLKAALQSCFHKLNSLVPSVP